MPLSVPCAVVGWREHMPPSKDTRVTTNMNFVRRSSSPLSSGRLYKTLVRRRRLLQAHKSRRHHYWLMSHLASGGLEGPDYDAVLPCVPGIVWGDNARGNRRRDAAPLPRRRGPSRNSPHALSCATTTDSRSPMSISRMSRDEDRRPSHSRAMRREALRSISPSCHDRQCRVPLVQSSGRTLL